MRKLYLLVLGFLLLTGCSLNGRDINTVEKSILGHWQVVVDENTNIDDTSFTDYYFAEDGTMISVKNGTKTLNKYKIRQGNESDNWLEIKVFDENSDSFIEKIQFKNEQRISVLRTVFLDSMEMSSDDPILQATVVMMKEKAKDRRSESEWGYVDDKTQP